MITIKRTAAIGDILMVTPLVQALRQKYGAVSLQVAPSLHDKMHDLLQSGVFSVVRHGPAPIIDLDGAYEMRPHLHPVEAYARIAGIGLTDTTAGFCNMSYSLTFGKFDVVIHATRSWQNRTLPISFWAELVDALQAEGLTVACVAQNVGEVAPNCDGVFLGQTLSQVAGLIQYGASVFIGGDSAPLHLAAATDTPIIGLFTIALAERRRPWGRPYETFVGINSAVGCVGCLHRAPMPCSFIDCEHSDERKHQCLKGFSIPEIVEHARGFCE